MPAPTDILNLAMSKIDQAYSYGVQVDYDDPDWPGPWDCAEFATWVTQQVSGVLFGTTMSGGVRTAHTGAWIRDAIKHGLVISVNEAIETPGTALAYSARPWPVPLRYFKGDPKPGHVAFSQGNGTTIEAHSESQGVGEHAAHGREWTHGIRLPNIMY